MFFSNVRFLRDVEQISSVSDIIEKRWEYRRKTNGARRNRTWEKGQRIRTTNCEINQSFWLLPRGVDTPRVESVVILRRRLLSEKGSIDREIRTGLLVFDRDRAGSRECVSGSYTFDMEMRETETWSDGRIWLVIRISYRISWEIFCNITYYRGIAP